MEGDYGLWELKPIKTYWSGTNVYTLNNDRYYVGTKEEMIKYDDWYRRRDAGNIPDPLNQFYLGSENQYDICKPFN